MQWQQTHTDSTSKARCGTLTFPSVKNATHETPLYVIHTRRGVVPHLTPDMLQEALRIRSDAQPSYPPVMINYWDIAENTDTIYNFKDSAHRFAPQPITTSTDASSASEERDNDQQHVRFFQRFFNLESHPVLLTLRDPQYPFYYSSQSGNDHILGDTSSGRKKLMFNEYMDIVRKLQPDSFVTLNDELSPHFTSKKKAQKFDEKNTKWMQSSLQLATTAPTTAETETPLPPMIVALFGVDSERKDKCFEVLNGALESAQKPEAIVPAVVIGGVGLGEQPTERFAVIDNVVQTLRPTIARMVPGQDHPYLVLESVSRGADLFDGVYPFTLADLGLASTFPLDFESSSSTATLTVKRPMKINLHDARYRRDKRPLVSESADLNDGFGTCTCLTCRKHSRAYIHHLLNTHEMLAHVLLTIHNLHHYERFFSTIREHIKYNTLASFKERFQSTTQ